MPIETFNFPFHSTVTENPVSGTSGALGGSYTFTTPPSDPDQRKFNLTFDTMRYFLNNLDMLDTNIYPESNMKNMIDFYARHKLYKNFKYLHPVYGELLVRFDKPLVEESAIPQSFGLVKSFTVQLIEIP